MVIVSEGQKDGATATAEETAAPVAAPGGGTAPAVGGEEEDTATFTWKVPNWSQQREKMYSPEFCTKKYRWRMMLLPRGNGYDTVALYMQGVGDKDKAATAWAANVYFVLRCHSSTGPALERDSTHKFTPTSPEWGFARFLAFRDVTDRSMGYLTNNTMTFEATVQMSDDLEIDLLNYDSKKETGFVGIKNQGATCYMNSLLQALYHVCYFRQCVYNLPTEHDNPEKSIPLALQRLFYKLQFGDRAAGTKELTKSFGWDSMEAFYQHDVQELNRVLMDNIETKMKGTAVEGAVSKLFEGQMYNYIKCVNVAYESARTESFYDISLNVKGLRNVYEAFEMYTGEEDMVGDNQYRTDTYGLQDAKMGRRFEKFPPVLFIHLKRFEYDFERDVNVKINDRFEFPIDLDLDRFMKDDVDRSVPQHYELHGVLIHSGDVHGGHYYAFLRPGSQPQWYKFDDDIVTKASARQAVDDNFGITPSKDKVEISLRNRVMLSQRYTNAYMLLYIRRADLQWAMAPVVDEMVPGHLRTRLEAEEAEKEAKRREKAEEHLYQKIKLVLPEDLAKHDDVDLVKMDALEPVKILKTATLMEFKQLVAEKTGVSPRRQRYWTWLPRRNGTVRPEACVPDAKNDRPVQELFRSNQCSALLLEVSPVADSEDAATQYFAPLDPTNIMVFVKHYDPAAQKLRYMGRHFLPRTAKAADLTPIFNRLVGQPPDTPLLIFEEVKPQMVDLIKPDLALSQQEFVLGDIIGFQNVPPRDVAYAYPTMTEFFVFLDERMVVRFRELSKPADDVHVLEVVRNLTYDDVAVRIGGLIGAAGENIRFHSYSTYHKGPKFPIKRSHFTTGAVVTLKDMLVIPSYYYNTPPTYSDILYYEVLDMPLREFETKTRFEVHFYNDRVERVSTHVLMVPKRGTAGDLIDMARAAIEATPGRDKPLGPLRLMEISSHKIFRSYQPRDPIAHVNENAHIRIEEVPEDQRELPEGARLVQCAHFSTDVFHHFGQPFQLLVHKDDRLPQLRDRVRAKLSVTDEEDFATWRFAIVSMSRPEWLADDTLVLKREFWFSDYVGIQHVDKTPPSQRERDNRWHREERAIKIYN